MGTFQRIVAASVQLMEPADSPSPTSVGDELERWLAIDLAGKRRERLLDGLMRMIGRLERISRPRLRFLFEHRLSSVIFGSAALSGIESIL